jgi:hypothetical protein
VSKQIFSKFQNFRSVLIYGSLNEILVVTKTSILFTTIAIIINNNILQGVISFSDVTTNLSNSLFVNPSI